MRSAGTPPKVIGNLGGFYMGDGAGGYARELFAGVTVRPAPHWEVSVGPSLSRSHTVAQYLMRVPDPLKTETFGARYAYTFDGSGSGEIETETFNAYRARVTFGGSSVQHGGKAVALDRQLDRRGAPGGLQGDARRVADALDLASLGAGRHQKRVAVPHDPAGCRHGHAASASGQDTNGTRSRRRPEPTAFT